MLECKIQELESPRVRVSNSLVSQSADENGG